ncbi:LysR substrate-binding domain-containing protein [Flavobacterium algicola]|uniref:LysR substrate-binding domain-containing protein n=1 Tax=Flavobacterium algicola TaxID=556529 RepID=UPI001EFC3400|nr:LysR substrate-binding domain-containing protein [Flavobacterium algicola]MCG9792209.1 LysR substrate-binding domain-containing protein [Flavobacterium algicola]
MNYTLHQLYVFLKVAQNMSITKAAVELHLTQPAVSIQLRNFQDQFEFPLTEVIGRKLYITDFGQEIATAAERVLNEVEAINYKTLAYKGELSGRLKISIVSTGKYIMPYFLSDFLKQNPGVDLILDVTNKKQVLESLEHNEVDFSLVSVLPDGIQIEKVELLPNALYMMVNANQAFDKKNNEVSILEDLAVIYREEGSGTRYIMEKFIDNNNLNVPKKIELTGNEAVKQAVLAGLGCSIMPLIGVKNELNNGSLQIVPVKGLPIKSNWNLIWLKGKKFSPVANAYLQFIKTEKERLIAESFYWIEKKIVK